MKQIETRINGKGKVQVICVRSFFNNALSRRRKTHRAWTMAATTLFLLLTLTVIFINTQAGFAVYFNGEPIGSAKSMEEVSAMVTGAEEQLTEIFGRDYSLENAISVTADLGAKAVNTENMKESILEGIDGVAKMYVLEVNGTTVGASDDQRVLDAILDSFLDQYTTPLTSSVRFINNVTVSYGFVNKDVTQDAAAIKAMLDPMNADSPCRLMIENTEQLQYTQEIGFGVQYYEDSTVYQGNTTIVTTGVPGESRLTENTVYLNGAETSKQVISTIQTLEPVTEVVAVGTAPRPKTASYNKYIWPAEGEITSYFGLRTGFGSSNHQGIDIGGFNGEDIVAADGGEVIMADWYSGYGLMVQIRHDNGDMSYYGHCSELFVQEGERVYQGQVIASMGQTGVANGVHCHFEIRVNSEAVDPMDYLPNRS